MGNQEERFEAIWPWLRVLIGLVCAVILLHVLRQLASVLVAIMQILAPFVIALIVAYVFHPIVSFVQVKLKLGRAAGIAVLALSIGLVVAGALVWLIPVLYQQLLSGIDELTKLISGQFDKFIAQHPDMDTLKELQGKFKALTGQKSGAVQQGISSGMGAIQPVAQGSFNVLKTVIEKLFSSLRATVSFIATAAFVIVISFYFLADMGHIPKVIRKMLPEARRERIWAILIKANRDVGGFLRGQLIACLIVGVLTTILLFIVGLKQYAVLIGFFAGLMHFIPYLGPIAGATPALLWVVFTQSLDSWGERGLWAGVLVIGFVIIELIDGFISQPFIVGKSASLHPLTVMLALAIGAQFGLGGMIIAVPMACIVRVLWIEFFWGERFDGVRSEMIEKGAVRATPKESEPDSVGGSVQS